MSTRELALGLLFAFSSLPVVQSLCVNTSGGICATRPFYIFGIAGGIFVAIVIGGILFRCRRQDRIRRANAEYARNAAVRFQQPVAMAPQSYYQMPMSRPGPIQPSYQPSQNYTASSPPMPIAHYGPPRLNHQPIRNPVPSSPPMPIPRHEPSRPSSQPLRNPGISSPRVPSTPTALPTPTPPASPPPPPPPPAAVLPTPTPTPVDPLYNPTENPPHPPFPPPSYSEV